MLRNHTPPSKLGEKDAHTQINKRSREACTVNQMHSSFQKKVVIQLPELETAVTSRVNTRDKNS